MTPTVDVAARSSGAPAVDPPGHPDTPGPRSHWTLGDRRLVLDGPLVMGILNLTPDSFSDGGDLPDLDSALDRASSMIAAGAGILDVGGESTRPGAPPVSARDELERVLPFVKAAVSSFSVPVSVDTRKASVAAAALEAGAQVVNDVSALAHDPEMAEVVASSRAGVILMHMRGEPADMRSRAEYEDVTAEVLEELGQALDRALAAGIEEDRVVLDPGIGFAKTTEHNLTLLRELDRLLEPGLPLLVGASRKTFLGEVLGLPPRERVEGTLAACVLAYLRGARIFRVHDVEPAVRALGVARAVEEGVWGAAASTLAADGGALA